MQAVRARAPQPAAIPSAVEDSAATDTHAAAASIRQFVADAMLEGGVAAATLRLQAATIAAAAYATIGLQIEVPSLESLPLPPAAVQVVCMSL